MTSFFSTNPFDIAILVCLFLAVVMGFMGGLLRGLRAFSDILPGWA